MITLEAKLADLESWMGSVTVEVGSDVFQNLDDCVKFVSNHIPGQTYGFFYDMVSLLQRAWGQNHITVSKHWDELYARKKAGFSSLNKAVISASMTTVLPSCLGQETGKRLETIVPLSAIATGQQGRKHKVSQCILKI